MGKRYNLPVPFGWFGIAFSDELAIGEVKPLHYFGRDIVLFRTESGEAKVLDAYCPHLGAHLGHGGSVEGESIACPFHGWQFNGDGECTKVPYAKNMPPKVKDTQCTLAYHAVEMNNTIWCWYHPDNIEPQFDLVKIDELYSDEWEDEFRHYDWVVNAAVQETAENAADIAHFEFVHTSKEVPLGEVTLDGPQRHAHIVSQTAAMNEDGTMDTTGTKFRDSYLDTHNNGPGQTWQTFTGLFDIMMLALITPINDDHLNMRFAFKQKKGLNETQKFMADALVEHIARQVEEDIPIWENKVHKPNPILCDGDGPIAQFRKWFSQFYTSPLDPELISTPSVDAPDKSFFLDKISRRPHGKIENIDE